MEAREKEDTSKYFKKALHVTYFTVFVFGYVMTVGMRYLTKLFPSIEPAMIFAVLVSLGAGILYFGYRKAKFYSNRFYAISQQ